MKVHIKKWGNSASVRIPAAVMEAASLSLDQSVDIREEAGRIIIEPIRTPAYDLDRLLDRMTPGAFPDDADFGPPVGSEVRQWRTTRPTPPTSSGCNSILGRV